MLEIKKKQLSLNNNDKMPHLLKRGTENDDRRSQSIGELLNFACHLHFSLSLFKFFFIFPTHFV